MTEYPGGPTDEYPDAEGVHRRLTRVFEAQLARNTPHFGGGGPGYYGVRLENVAPDGSSIDLVVTFRSGVRYCCMETGCHFGVGHEGYWSRLRKDMNAHHLSHIPLPTIRVVRMLVEDGCLIDLSPGKPRTQKAMTYEVGPFDPVE
jgi:hypothetical protein